MAFAEHNSVAAPKKANANESEKYDSRRQKFIHTSAFP